MKHFYFAALSAFLAVQSFAQTLNEGFESVSNLSTLTNNCWAFTGVGLSTTTGITGTHSLSVIPTTSNANSSTNANMGMIVTPYINFVASTNLTIDVKISNNLASQAERVVQARLLDQNGNYSAYLAELVLNNTSNAASTYTLIVPIPVTGQRKLVVDISGHGDGNTYTFIDNLVYAGSVVGCTANAPLPVRLMDFAGGLMQNRAQLKWSVAENETGKYFEVEKSTNGRDFSNIGIVFNSTRVGVEAYSFTESSELTEDSYYRLKMLNNDGSFGYSRIIALKNFSEAAGDKGITMMQNPIGSSLNFSFNASSTGVYYVSLYSMYGVKVYGSAISCQAGTNAVSLPIGDQLSSGTYVLEVTNYKERRTTKTTR